MIGVIASLEVIPDKQAEFEGISNRLIALVHANEPDTVSYLLFKSKTSNSTYVFMEQYASMDALKRHGRTEYFKQAQSDLTACLSSPPKIEMYELVEQAPGPES